MAEKQRSEGGSRKSGSGVAGLDGAMLATAVVVAVLAIPSALLLGFAGQQVAVLVLSSLALVIGVWTLAKRRVSSTADTEGSATDAERSNVDTRVVVVLDDETPQHPKGEIREFKGQKLGVIDFGPDLSRDLRRQIDKNILTRGKPFESGGMLDTACLPMVGAGSAATSALLAGNVFLATANPATLMQIGTGVGSAVVGPGGIIAQAPFVAASGAILPVDQQYRESALVA